MIIKGFIYIAYCIFIQFGVHYPHHRLRRIRREAMKFKQTHSPKGNYIMKKFLAVFLTILLATIGFAGCASSKTEIDKIKEKGVLTVYTNAAFAPYEYYSGTEITGVDIEISKAIAEKLGVELKVEDVEFNNIIAAVKEGKCDLGVSGFSVTDERKQSVDFSVEYVQTQQYIILLDTDTAVINFETLAGAKIGVQLSTTGDYAIDDAITGGCLKDTGAVVSQYKNALEATVDLKNGKISAVVIDRDTALNIVNNNTGLKAIPLNYADGTFDAEEYAIAIAKENTTLKDLVNEVLTGLIADGSIAKWMTEHSAASVG